MQCAQEARLIEILLVEDSPSDVRLTELALAEAKVLNRLSVAKDGVVALAFLRRQGQYCDVPGPDLILLDLNLPRKDGQEVLAEIKQDPDLRLIPVVTLTTSKEEGDVLNAYGLHANKPVDLGQFMHAIESIEGFWLGVVTLPAK